MQIENTKKSVQYATDIFTQAMQINYNAKSYRKSQKPKWSRFKLKFQYKDGNQSIHYSYDWNADYTGGMKKYKDDEQLGFSKLILLIDKMRQKDCYNSATIYMTLSDKKDTSINDYDVSIGYIQRGKDISIDNRLKFENNRVVLNLFKNS